VGWFQPHLKTSLELIHLSGVTAASRILDVGGGASTLVDDLLDEGFQDVSVLDISPVALRLAGIRLGERGNGVRWIEGDVTRLSFPPLQYDLWHDRAVFHFLTAPEDRRAYVAAAVRALKDGGHLIVATFAPTGPPRCSGLDAIRHSPDSLRAEFGALFRLVRSVQEVHSTPGGAKQDFIYCLFRRADAVGSSPAPAA
jgi:ubiquinone/menaquinone biosynthesis C-methylase UbiE